MARGGQRITFQLTGEAAAIHRRAAVALGLAVVHTAPDTFDVVLEDAMDAYRLADRCVADPAWAHVFPYGGRRTG